MSLPPSAKQIAQAARASRGGSSGIQKRISVLGRLEQTLLLATLICGPKATINDIRSKVEQSVGVRSLTTVFVTLDRMAEKGLLEVTTEDTPTRRKGGRKRTLYKVTDAGRENVARDYLITVNLAREAGLIEKVA